MSRNTLESVIAALVLAPLLGGCLATPSDDPEVVFEHVWSEFDTRYGGFEDRNIDWDAAYDTFRPQVNADSTDDELFDALSGLLAVLDDGHVRLVAPDREMFSSNHVYRDKTMEGTFDEDLVRTYLTDPDTGPWDWYLRGEVAPDVAYLWLPGIDDNTWVINDILDDDPAALIIDLRHSHGGAATYFHQGVHRLIQEDLAYCRTRSKQGPDRDDFSDWFTWTVEAQEGYWGGPIYVLTDAESVSATERMLMFLQMLPNVTTIGVPTNGALANSVGIEAPNGWGIQLPVQEVETVDGRSYEGIGLSVDIEMLNDPADVAGGHDEVLEAAIAMATNRAP